MGRLVAPPLQMDIIEPDHVGKSPFMLPSHK